VPTNGKAEATSKYLYLVTLLALNQLLVYMKKYLFVLPLLISIYSCKTKPSKEVTVPEKQIGKVNFFLETSASMAGYFNGPTEFVRDIPNLLVDIEGRELGGKGPLKIYYVADSLSLYPKTTQDFIRDISTTRVANEKSSEMHKILEMIASKTDSNDISLFVSDCILSYPDDVIKTNPEINKQKAPGELKALVKDTFLKLKRNDISASLYGFSSAFFGNYYTYQNTKIKLNGEQRPYYLWVIGNKELVTKFNQQLAGVKNFNPVIDLNFGLFEKTIEAFDTFFTYEREGEWKIDNQGISELKASKKQSASFAIAVDLAALPSTISAPDYLKKNLKTSSENLDFKIKNILLATDVDKSKLKPREKEYLEKNTHVIVLEVSDLYKDRAKMDLKLPLIYDNTYKEMSTMDDRSLDAIPGKTFAFEHLIDGVREAYENSNDNFIHISIPVKK
jgi:vacuolar-type H+-ATPase subunit F/Vma7